MTDPDAATAQAAALFTPAPVTRTTEFGRIHAAHPDLAQRLAEVAVVLAEFGVQERLAELRKDSGELRMQPAAPGNARLSERIFETPRPPGPLGLLGLPTSGSSE